MAVSKEISNDSASQTSITDIRNKVDDLHALLIFFKNTFNQNAYDSVLKEKQAMLERELLEEIEGNDYSNAEMARQLSSAFIECEKQRFNLGRLQLFQNEIVSRVLELRNIAANRTREGRSTNELMFEFSRLTVKEYRHTHSGRYPSANYLSNKVSDQAKSVFEALQTDIDSFEGPLEFKKKVFDDLKARDNKLAKEGTDFLPIRTADSYIKRIKSENEKIGSS